MHWNIGNIKVTTIVEQDLTDLDALIPQATQEVVKTIDWLQPHYATAEGTMLGVIQAFIIETPDHCVVVDTCVGNDRERLMNDAWHRQQRRFLEKFEEAGYATDAIDFVLCTHLHFDHVGWNTYRDGDQWRPTFPNARYLFAEQEYQFWQEALRQAPLQAAADASEEEQMTAAFDAMTRTTHLDSIVPIIEAGLSDLVPGDHEVCPGVSLVPTHGHTPGHVSVLLRSQGVEAIITGDAIHHPVQIAETDFSTRADIDPECGCRTRQQILEQAVASRQLLIGTHFAEPAVGRVTRQGDGFRFDGVVGEDQF